MNLAAGIRQFSRKGGRIACISVCSAVLATATVLLWPMDTTRYLRVEGSQEVVDRHGQPLMSFLNEEEQWCFPRELDAISPYLVQATLAVEDHRFHTHPGVDPVAIGRAIVQNARQGGVRSGASTLTMQVVKRQQASSRSLTGKALQAIQALRLDARVSKEPILETYLNTAPYGLNLLGCEAAARRYFGVPARELSLSQAAILAGLPKSPTRFMPLRNADAARQRRNFVLDRMHAEGYVNADELNRSKSEPLGVAWHDYPMVSPHLAVSLRADQPKQHLIETTLDYTTQRRAEAFVAEHLRYYGGSIDNAALLVIDVKEAAVLARVGSGGFLTLEDGGQVDAIRTLRSPGSTLKPFLYAYAMESDLLYPRETLYDNTLDYGMYTPENFDGTFNGLVTAGEALQQSLNIPAIALLSRVGVGRFMSFLPELGIDTVTNTPDHYGLGLTLGNCEVRLEDLAAAYCMLANLGELRSLNVLADAERNTAIRVLAPGTCAAIYEMLEQPLPAEFTRDLVPMGNPAPRVCWKTGTSADNRDAWAFVFNAHYLVGVWMGNSSGARSKWLVGADAALPLAAKLFRSLPAKGTPSWPETASELKPVTVCAASGLPTTPWCPHTREDWVPRAQYLLRRCGVHNPGHGGDDIIALWPGSAMQWDLASIPGNAIHPITPSVASTPVHEQRQDRLRIQHPANRAAFILTESAQGDQISLRATADRDSLLHWYLDRAYLGASHPNQALTIDLKPGSHRVTCMSPSGEVDSVSFGVARPGFQSKIQ